MFSYMDLLSTTLINFFIKSNKFSIDSFGFPVYTIMTSSNNNSFISSFKILILFFSCLAVLSKTSRTIMTKDCDSPYIITYLKSSVLTFHP